jgi:hypothetical protein
VGKSLAVRKTAFAVHLLGVPWHAAGATACLQDSNRCAETFHCDIVAVLPYDPVIKMYCIPLINRERSRPLQPAWFDLDIGLHDRFNAKLTN